MMPLALDVRRPGAAKRGAGEAPAAARSPPATPPGSTPAEGAASLLVRMVRLVGNLPATETRLSCCSAAKPAVHALAALDRIVAPSVKRRPPTSEARSPPSDVRGLPHLSEAVRWDAANGGGLRAAIGGAW